MRLAAAAVQPRFRLTVINPVVQFLILDGMESGVGRIARWTGWGIAGLSAFLMAAAPGQAADLAKGETLYNRMCKSCHAMDTKTRRSGPHFEGLWGRKAGAVEGFRYRSKAYAESGIVWNAQTLNPFLENPRKMMPGTNMIMVVRDAKQRADLIAYLEKATAK